MGCEWMCVKVLDIGIYVILPENVELNDLKAFVDGVETKIYDIGLKDGDAFANIHSSLYKDKIIKTEFYKKLGTSSNQIIYVSNSAYIDSNIDYSDVFSIYIKKPETATEEISYVFKKDYLKPMQEKEFEDVLLDSPQYGQISCLFNYYYTLSL